MLEAYLRSLVSSSSSIDDLFQETMLVAWRRLGVYDRSRPFGPWLRGIAQVLVLEHARKGRARPLTTDPEVLVHIDRRFDLLGSAPGDTFLEKVDRLWACLAKVPDHLREALELVYGRDMTAAAAADSVGASREAFWKRVQRGRQMLAECMGVGEKSA